MVCVNTIIESVVCTKVAKKLLMGKVVSAAGVVAEIGYY